MSIGVVGSKHTVFDVYPLRRKKVLVLVDPQNILGETSDFHATLDTITHLLTRDASVVIAASFGPVAGVPLNLSKKEREGAIEAFQREGGLGYTNYFSGLPPAAKVEILNSIPNLPMTQDMERNSPNTGKTTLFAGLTNEVKKQALRRFDRKREFPPCSTFPFVAALQTRFPGVKVHFSPDCVRAPLHTVAPGEIIVLENLRLYQNEASPQQEERQAMAEVLASGVNIFINDSFASAHHVTASTVELPKILQHGAAGQSMDRELAFYSKFLSHPGRPLAVVVGGTNVVSKLQLIRSLIGRADRILVAGAPAYPFMVAKGLSCGLNYPVDDEPTIPVTSHFGMSSTTSLERSVLVKGKLAQGEKRMSAISHPTVNGGTMEKVADKATSGAHKCEKSLATSSVLEVPCSVYASEILDLCEQYEVELILPIDHIVTTNPDGSKSKAVLVESTAVPPGLYAMDCGVNTINLFERVLRDCRTVFWTGTLGWSSKGYTAGTSAFATTLGRSNHITIVGGRSTAQVVRDSGVAGKILHISSGGTSTLHVLQGNPLPGIEALSDVASKSEDSALSVHELVRNLPMFAGCNSHQLKVIAKMFVRRTHNKGDYLIYRGDRHVCLTLVAQGGLIARYGEEYTSAPSRYILRGQTAGTYGFVTQAPAMETIRAAQNGTIVYQLSSSALNELLNAHPDLAAQLFQNVTDPLRIIANEDYHAQQTNGHVVRRNACRTRVPVLDGIPPGSGMWEDIVQDIVATVSLQRFTMQYTPYVPIMDTDVHAELARPRGAIEQLLGPLAFHEHLGMALVCSCVRNVVYHNVVERYSNPWVASVLGGACVAPLRLLAYGIRYNDINFKLVVDEGLIDAASGVVPLLAYHLTLKIQQWIERQRKRRIGRIGRALLSAVVKLLLGILVFPVVYQRNFVYTQPSASRFWDHQAFRAYQVKQVVAIFLRFAVHRARKTLPF